MWPCGRPMDVEYGGWSVLHQADDAYCFLCHPNPGTPFLVPDPPSEKEHQRSAKTNTFFDLPLVPSLVFLFFFYRNTGPISLGDTGHFLPRLQAGSLRREAISEQSRGEGTGTHPRLSISACCQSQPWFRTSQDHPQGELLWPQLGDTQETVGQDCTEDLNPLPN